MALMALLALTPACGFGGASTKSDGGLGDDDAPTPFPFCHGSFVKVCFSTDPTATKTFTVPTTTIDTGSTTDCDQQNDQKDRYCVVAGNGFTIASGQKLVAHGAKPLVLLSTAMFDVSGDIDVSSSTQAQTRGPGADPVDCANGTPPTASAGGYGGSFQGQGGSGSQGENSDGTGGIPPAALTAFPSVLHGGCPGGAGAVIGPLGEGRGGSGGGAIAIIAAQLRVNASINASGAGGRGAQGSKTGGGGGGTGGMIVLESSLTAIEISSRAAIWANGGGGGQGGATGLAGANGNESSAPDSGARATLNGNPGANGGPGSVGSTLTGGLGRNDAQSGGGGGGGGGGAGFIHAQGVLGTTTISPASLDLPL